MPSPLGLNVVNLPKKPVVLPIQKWKDFTISQPPFSELPEPVDTTSLKGKTIMVNPGHGEFKQTKSGKYIIDEKTGQKKISLGANYKLDGKLIEERNLNDSVAVQVKKGLEERGAKVIYLDNTPLKDIRRLENKYKPDLFISIHHDAKGPGATATNSGETVYAHGKKSLKAANAVNERLKANPYVPNNDCNNPNRIKWAGELFILKYAKSPAVITELGFLSNEEELRTLIKPEFQKSVAKSLVKGIKDFFKPNNYVEVNQVK